jgi:hypothetical protein
LLQKAAIEAGKECVEKMRQDDPDELWVIMFRDDIYVVSSPDVATTANDYIEPTPLVKETWNWEHFGSRNPGHELAVGSHYLYSMAWVILIPKQVKKVEKHCSWLQYTRFT